MSPLTALIFRETDRQRMLHDIARIALMIGQDLYPEADLTDGDVDTLSASSAADRVLDICPRERIAFLSAIWPKFENALRRIEAAPDTLLASEVRMTPLETARHATPNDLLTALTRAPQNGGIRRVREHVSVISADTPANRLIKSGMAMLLRDLNAMAALAAVSGASEVERQTWRLRSRLRVVLRREPWQTLPVTKGNNLPPLPQSVRHNGPYRLVYDLLRQYRHGFALDWNQPLFTLSTRDMWLLYEYWCLFQGANTLREMGFRATGADTFALSRSGLTFTLVRGRASSLRFTDSAGKRLTLTYNRDFPTAVSRRRDGWYSRSHSMRPDIVIEANGRLLTLDAKFKTYAEPQVGDEANLPLTSDINQCHAYRDGILYNGTSTVAAAWLLYPGRATGGNRTIISYEPNGWSEVGALLLRPANESSLKQLIKHSLFANSE